MHFSRVNIIRISSIKYISIRGQCNIFTRKGFFDSITLNLDITTDIVHLHYFALPFEALKLYKPITPVSFESHRTGI